MSINVDCLTFNAFQENTFILSDETKECIIIDPGCYSETERQTLTAYIEKNELKVKQLYNTHCHIDHVLGNSFVMQTFNTGLFIHRSDLETLRAVKLYSAQYGFPAFAESEPTGFLEEGDVIRFGNSELIVIFTPGHAPGHVVFYSENDGICINGDVLFRGSIGRTDLPGGDAPTLFQSIREKMFTLPDETLIYTGHGPSTTIGFEKENNPFVGVNAKPF